MYFKNFTIKEVFAHCTKNEIVTALGNKEIMSNILDLLHLLQQIRDLSDCVINVNSGYRDSDHNSRVGGEPSSQHLKGQAADIQTPNNMSCIYKVLMTIKEKYPNEIGQVIMYVPKAYQYNQKINGDPYMLSQVATFFHVALPNDKYKCFTPSIKFV